MKPKKQKGSKKKDDRLRKVANTPTSTKTGSPMKG
jgi:hypothetical protein